MLRRLGTPALRTAGTLALLFAPACGPKEDTRAAAADSAAAAPADSAGMGPMAGRSMTGDADRDFLRMMSDHHKGLIAIAHESMEGERGTAQSRTDARNVDNQHDHELERMLEMLKANYQDAYEPSATPTDQAALDSMLRISSPAYAVAFYHTVIAHHRRALAMIEEYLPKSKRAEVKALAEQMRTHQREEIGDFGRKAGR